MVENVFIVTGLLISCTGLEAKQYNSGQRKRNTLMSSPLSKSAFSRSQEPEPHLPVLPSQWPQLYRWPQALAGRHQPVTKTLTQIAAE